MDSTLVLVERVIKRLIKRVIRSVNQRRTNNAIDKIKKL
jgi:hypothetical protein